MFGLVPAPPVEPAFVLLLAMALEAAVGDMRAAFRVVPHPLALIGRLVGFLENRLNRESRGESDRALRGAVVAMAVTLLAALAGWLVVVVLRGFSWGWLIEILLLAMFITQRSTYSRAALVARGLDSDGAPGGRLAARDFIAGDPGPLDEYGIVRANIESLFRRFAHGLVAPVFWYLLAGLPGLFAFHAVDSLDRQIGHLTPRYRAFGSVAARLDTVLSYIPARLAGLFVTLTATFAPTAAPLGSLRIMLADAGKHRSVNDGWPVGAAAGALNLALAGPRRVDGLAVNDPWIGRGRARAHAADIRRALFLFVVSCLIVALLVGVAAIVSHAELPQRAI